MRSSIAVKLILAFLAVSLLSLIIVGVLTRTLTNDAFRRYLTAQDETRVVETFATYFENNGSWDGASDAIDRRYLGMVPFTLLDINKEVVYSAQGQGNSQGMKHSGTPLSIIVDGETVGYLLMPEGYGAGRPTGPGDVFLERLDQIFSYSVVGAAVFALILGLVLSRYLTRPIRELTAATRAVADGDLEQVVPVRSKDELGALADSFNRMNKQLARSMDQRRQMTADIAHELRTPLSVILGHAEGIHDGVLPLSLETVDIIRDEATRLERLVEDLRTISLADAGELPLMLAPISPTKLLEEIRARYLPRAMQKKVTLDAVSTSDLPQVQVDFDRLLQVFSNLLDNALRYTPADGHIQLSAQKVVDGVEITVQDSGEGLPPEQAAHIFDRFYRADPSRQREEGGSGLGLAISRSIVEEHGGRILATSASGNGLTIKIVLPNL